MASQKKDDGIVLSHVGSHKVYIQEYEGNIFFNLLNEGNPNTLFIIFYKTGLNIIKKFMFSKDLKYNPITITDIQSLLS